MSEIGETKIPFLLTLYVTMFLFQRPTRVLRINEGATLRSHRNACSIAISTFKTLTSYHSVTV